jgi:hypothetical protein
MLRERETEEKKISRQSIVPRGTPSGYCHPILFEISALATAGRIAFSSNTPSQSGLVPLFTLLAKRCRRLTEHASPGGDVKGWLRRPPPVPKPLRPMARRSGMPREATTKIASEMSRIWINSSNRAALLSFVSGMIALVIGGWLPTGSEGEPSPNTAAHDEESRRESQHSTGTFSMRRNEPFKGSTKCTMSASGIMRSLTTPNESEIRSRSRRTL